MIIILTGAGISQESGISTFRDAGGLWENERIEDVGTPGGFARDPDKVLDFYNRLRRNLKSPEITPNPAHHALARLEKESREQVLVITQNIDNLHERAGTKNLLHMHGELYKARCNACGTVTQWETDMSRQDVCEKCGTAGRLRPHIVWFEEMPLYMDEIWRAFSKCRLFVSIGTSGHVHPAAGFVKLAQQAGARTLELNLERSLGAWFFHDGRYGKAGKVVPAWVEEILAG
ncbi:NAD-dependent protein deacylase [Oxalobacter sp. OttesenSCG-928-P03]|nr:NAD-dependent protein deacylase [Oxalobacter sp. OttesenSCG-928-P03]